MSNTIAHGETNAEYHFPGETEGLTRLGNENLQEILDSLDRYVDRQNKLRFPHHRYWVFC